MIDRRAAVALLVLALSACGPSEQPDIDATSPAATTPLSRVLNISGLKTGPAPKIAWANGTLLNGDDDLDVLPANLDQFARTKQLLVISDIEGNVFAYAPDGPVGTTPIGQTTGRLAINDKRNLVAWIAPDGSPTVLQEGEARPVVLRAWEGVTGDAAANHPHHREAVTSGDAVAVHGHDCFNGPETVEGAGCAVAFRTNGEAVARSYSSSNHGIVQPIDETNSLFKLQDSDEAGTVGWTKVKEDFSTCSAHAPHDGMDPDNDVKSWRTCAFMPLAFSPDGKRILATGPHGYEGLGTSDLVILDRATGKPSLTVSNQGKTSAAIIDMAWEDDTHVLAVVNQKLDWAIVRVGLDGSMELAGELVSTAPESEDYPFRLAVQP